MSTTYIPFAFYGRYFSSETDAQKFLASHADDYDSDSIHDEKETTLGLQYLRESVYILGFPLKAGQSDEAAKALWAKRLGVDSEAKSSFEISMY